MLTADLLLKAHVLVQTAIETLNLARQQYLGESQSLAAMKEELESARKALEESKPKKKGK